VLAPANTARPRTIDDLLGRALIEKLDRLEVLSRKVFSGKLPGERRSRRKGSSVEFDDYRNYVAGDDLRRIDWNVFARMDKFFIKLFREEEDQSLHVVIDASPSMDAGAPSKLVCAQRVAMALSYIGLVNHSRVLVTIVGAPGRPNVQALAPVRGRRNTRRVADFILKHAWAPEGEVRSGPGVMRTGATPFTDAMRTIGMSRRGRGVMVVISDLLLHEDPRTALNFLTGGGFDVFVLQLLSPGELEPEKEAGGAIVGDLRFIDAEVGGGAEVTVSGAVLKRYKRRIAEHVESMRKLCAARDMGHAMIRSDADIGALLAEHLRKKGLLG
jgi:uncharacterized protein (DUF58 family)